MPKNPHLLCVLVALAAAVACSPASEETSAVSETVEPATPLLGTHWKLVELNGQPAEGLEGQGGPYLVLEGENGERRMHGSGGCNNMTGSYALENDQISFGPIAGTRMMCAQGMDQEHAFGQALDKIERFEITGPALALSGSDDTTLRFEAQQAD